MESIQKIFKNPKFRLLAVFLVFMAISGFLFLSVPKLAYAADPPQVPFGLRPGDAAIATVSDAAQ
ncbi:MAG TPA: hypothetical protein VF390_01500, partial [Patescibacteria group bacterium]